MGWKSKMLILIYAIVVLFFLSSCESATQQNGGSGQEAIFASSAQEARNFASAGNPNIPSYINETLTFLADRLEGKLHQSLSSDESKILAVGFIKDILEAGDSSQDGYQVAGGDQALDTDRALAGFQALTGYRQWAYRTRIDKTLQPYSLYVPPAYDPDKKYGLIVQLHGYSGNDYDGGLHLAKLEPEDLFIVSAYGRGDVSYESVAEQDVLDVMEMIVERYPIDPDRIYLTGNSMGGLGTWKIGQLYPDRFAAIAPFCGWTGTQMLDNLGNLETFIVHGEYDTSVSVDIDREAAAKLQEADYSVTYIEIPGGTHSAWTEWAALNDPNTFFDFLNSCVRDTSPEHIRAVIPTARYGCKYWVNVTELDTSGDLDYFMKEDRQRASTNFPRYLPAPGTIEAQRKGSSEILITTNRIRAFGIDLSLAGVDPSRTVTIDIDGQRHDIKPSSESISFHILSDGVWEIDGSAGSSKLARHDGDGVAGLFMKPLIIVYGTMDSQRSEALEAGARQLADWSWADDLRIGVKTGMFRVKADTELTEEDIQDNNLILVGNSVENTITARIADTFAPYYSAGKITVDGQAFSEAGLCVTRPNPLAPQRIVTCFDMPCDFIDSIDDVVLWFRFFSLRLRNNHSETGSYPGFCPDVMVLTEHPGIDAWSGWFDRNWENLEGQPQSD